MVGEDVETVKPIVSARPKKSKPLIPPNPEVKTEAQGHVVIVGGDIEGAKPIRQVQPVYPARALELGIEDVVTFEVTRFVSMERFKAP